jgi:hypothetical protein
MPDDDERRNAKQRISESFWLIGEERKKKTSKDEAIQIDKSIWTTQ